MMDKNIEEEKNKQKNYDELNELYGMTIIISVEEKIYNYLKYGVIDGGVINTKK